MVGIISCPPVSMIRWVGPHKVTSWPKIECQMSSSGNPSRANAPHAVMTRPLVGTTQVSLSRMPVRRASSPRAITMASQPAAKMPNSPIRIG